MCEHPSRLAHLREHTTLAHKRMEGVPALKRLVEPDLAQSDYARVLVSMLAFHTAIEPQIVSALEPWPDAQKLLDGRRLSALTDDIAYFGVEPSQELPNITPWPTPSQALGALYVVEGSSLGGRVIARHLKQNLEVSDGAGASFYDGLTADMARRRWASLCAVLEDPSFEIALDDLAAGACNTFDCLDRWMRRLPVTQSSQPTAMVSAA
jgi:heme oxygenase